MDDPAQNIDFAYEKIIRWLTLICLVPIALLAVISPAWTTAGEVQRALWVVPLLAQILFVTFYRRLPRTYRSAGMVLDYIVLALSVFLLVVMARYIIAEQTRITP